MKPEQWIINGETGTSSKTIWAVMMNAVMDNRKNTWDYGVPHDPDDLKRCVNMLTLIPEWRPRLQEVANAFPIWTPFVREWDKLEKMCWKWIADDYGRQDKGHATKLFDFIQGLNHEGLLLDGWIQNSPNSWHKDRKVA